MRSSFLVGPGVFKFFFKELNFFKHSVLKDIFSFVILIPGRLLKRA